MQRVEQKFLNCKTLISAGNAALQLVAQKFDEIEDMKHPVVPNVTPGFLRKMLPTHPPMQAESMEAILKDTEEKIFPGLTLWSHPNFYAYYPSNITHASIISEIFATAFGSPGFLWLVSPAQTELENIVMDWVVYAMNLPEHFLLKNSGGGTIANTTSDAVFLTIHVAKWRKMKELGISTDSPLLCKFVGYYGECAHGGAPKGLLMKDIHYKRVVPSYFCEASQNFQIDLIKFTQMIKDDISAGLIPFWFQATWGTTPTGANEQLDDLANICEKYKLWYNVDAAYSGSSWVIPEYREQAVGLERADSVELSFAKMMMTGINGSLFYVKEKKELSEAMGGKIEYQIYKNKFSDEHDILDYKDWQVALGKKFSSLKLWFMIRSVGVEGMREQLQEKIELSKYFDSLLKSSAVLKCFTKNELTLSTFVIKHEDKTIQNKLNRALYQKINDETSNGFISGSEVQGWFFLRVVIGNHTTTKEHLLTFYNHISKLSEEVLSEQ